MEKQLKQTIATVDEIERHVDRCRRDVDGLFVNWSENITDEYTQKFDKKAAEIDGRIETFDEILEKKCNQAGHTAAAYMNEVVGKHNANVQEVNEQLREQLTRLERRIDAKADCSETARLAAENTALKKRLVKYQQVNKSLFEKRGMDLVEVMRGQEKLSSWVRGVEKEHEAIVLASEADAKNRRILDRHLRAMERQQSMIYQVSEQAMIPVSREPPNPQDSEDGGCRQHEAMMKDLVKTIGDHDSRLRQIENAKSSPSPCQRCHATLEKVSKDLKDVTEALEVEKLESQQKLEDHKAFAKAQYQALQEKFDKLAGLVRELPDLPAYLQTVTRLEELEQDKLWNDRVRRLETYGAATPGPVLRHLEYLESRLSTTLYDRQVPLPSAVARERIAWAWETLENAPRAESQQAVPAETLQIPGIFHQKLRQQPQQPQQIRLESPSQHMSQEQVLTEPGAQLESTSQPIWADEVVPPSAADERSQENTSQMEVCQQVERPKSNSLQHEVQVPTTTVRNHGEMEQTVPHPPTVQSFGENLVSGFQAPSVDVPVMDWSASVSIDLSRDASEFVDDDTPRTKAPKENHPTILKEGDMHTEGPITTGSSDYGTTTASTATGAQAHPNYGASTQVAYTWDHHQEPVSGEDSTTGLDSHQDAGNQSTLSIVPTESSGADPLTIPGLEYQNHHISQPLYGGDASSGYTTVDGTQSLTQAKVSPPNASPYTAAIPALLLPNTCSSVVATSYSPTKPSPTNPTSQPRARYGPPEQQPSRSLTSSGLANYTPTLPSPLNPGMHLTQPVANTGIGQIVAPMAQAAEPQHHNTSTDEVVPDDERSQPQHSLEPIPEMTAPPRPVLQKPKGRMRKMTDQQKSAIRHEMERQKPGVGSMQELPPINPRPSTPPQPSFAPAQDNGASNTQNKGAGSSKARSSSTVVHEREDAVDYGSTDDDSPGPSSSSANLAPTPAVPAKVMRRYSTQWLKIWRSHVGSEQNIRRFAESNGFGDSADKWAAIVENANADTKPQALLSEAKIAVHRQLYSMDDVKGIAEAFFEVCLVQSGSFRSAIKSFDPFHMTTYHKSFVDAFQAYLQNHPADSY